MFSVRGIHNKSAPLPEADICLILEGTYPYTSGGVSSWTHDLIKMQKHLSFSIITLISADAPTKLMFELPPNIIGLRNVRLQSLPEGDNVENKALFSILKNSLHRLQSQAGLEDLAVIIEAFAPCRRTLGKRQLLDSHNAWELMLHMYQSTMPRTPFLDYFWSWRGLFGGLFSILLADLPPAKVYHSLCTGYAGLMLARAQLETGRPCVVTEHGIYTNERRIEIASADWIEDPHGFNMAISSSGQDRELKDFWIDTFSNYSRFCYEASTDIVTLYEGNQEFQRVDGANAEKLRVIPNGIDTERYGSIRQKPHAPTVALIGRVVPIKDIKNYIKAIDILKQSLPEIRAYMLGPEDEDPKYAAECRTLVANLNLEETLTFAGKVDIAEYLSVIDVIVLSSISEAQPLVILEAGAAGIPTVATDVGACREMIYGSRHETPKLGYGGIVVPLSNPRAIANALIKLFTEPEYYKNCSQAIMHRVRKYYSKEDQYNAYADLYGRLIRDSGNQNRQMRA